MKLIAFDSGLERTGWAVFELNGKDYNLIEYGCIFSYKKDDIQTRIASIYNDVQNLYKKHQPKIFVIEQLFFFSNKKTVIQVAQAQGAVMSIAGQHNLEVVFLTPPQIKQAITGYGKSDKKGVEKMVGLLLNMTELPTPDDTVDAIACGITYCTIHT